MRQVKELNHRNNMEYQIGNVLEVCKTRVILECNYLGLPTELGELMIEYTVLVFIQPVSIEFSIEFVDKLEKTYYPDDLETGNKVWFTLYPMCLNLVDNCLHF